MARYTGPKDKISRRFGVAIFGPSKAMERRNFAPGQHGARSGRKKLSDYAVALAEKQKLKYQYGMLERQFRKFFEEASRRRGITGVIPPIRWPWSCHRERQKGQHPFLPVPPRRRHRHEGRCPFPTNGRPRSRPHPSRPSS